MNQHPRNGFRQNGYIHYYTNIIPLNFVWRLLRSAQDSTETLRGEAKILKSENLQLASRESALKANLLELGCSVERKENIIKRLEVSDDASGLECKRVGGELEKTNQDLACVKVIREKEAEQVSRAKPLASLV